MNSKKKHRTSQSSNNISPQVKYMQINTPGDRNSQVDSHIIPKRKTMFDDLADRVLSLYSKGMSTSDIEERICERIEGKESVFE
ncbi:MAG: transposase [Thermotogaceae bacterium]|nr:transposase [Thermotogaceae bacterium]